MFRDNTVLEVQVLGLSYVWSSFFQLPVIAKGIGKRAFKMHIELFFDAIFYSLVSNA